MYQKLYNQLINSPLEKWLEKLKIDVEAAVDVSRNSDLKGWLEVIDNLSILKKADIYLDDQILTVGDGKNYGAEEKQNIENQLQKLHPWRKGPFNVHGVHIDTEWRSDWKWDRLEKHISPLKDKLVLDVGCGNGYHCWRMGLQDAKLVIGVDPVLKSVMQYRSIDTLINQNRVFVLPLRIEDIPKNLQCFDTVFSMGLLYHRKSPMEHLIDLKQCLTPKGELVLETLVIEGAEGEVFVPPGRYAKMRNVWFIPTPDTLVAWMEKCGFKDVKIVDVTRTTINEQRPTNWMREQSLRDFLDPNDHKKTIEGHPSPLRAILTGKKS